MDGRSASPIDALFAYRFCKNKHDISCSMLNTHTSTSSDAAIRLISTCEMRVSSDACVPEPWRVLTTLLRSWLGPCKADQLQTCCYRSDGTDSPPAATFWPHLSGKLSLKSCTLPIILSKGKKKTEQDFIKTAAGAQAHDLMLPPTSQ